MALVEYSIDPAHSSINFSVRHMVIAKVRGKFSEYSGQIRIDEEDFTRSSAELRVRTASIDTGVEDREKHLRSADFFDSEKHPEMRFVSRSITKTGDRRYKMSGELTIRDVTKTIELEVRDEGRGKDPWGNERAGYTVHGSLDRGDYGLRWNQALEAGGVLVGEKVDIDLELSMIRQGKTAAA